ncbi:hypothetical protein L7F22_062438 [Adiantum nelumboides]|nr:hypothetical protein [Adiantum nelumboides]
MIEDLPAANSQASLIQHARFVPKAIKMTTTAASLRTTRSTKQSSSDDEKTEMDKDEDFEKSHKEEDSQKDAEVKGPSEHEPSDQEDTSTPLDRKGKKPQTEEQILLDKAMARVEARKKVLANARAAKEVAKKLAQKMAAKEARKTRLEKVKTLQEERRRLEAEKKAQDKAAAAQGVQGAQKEKEKEVVDLTGTIEHLKKIEREKHIEEQRPTQFAREKIKEASRRKAEGPILELREGSLKRPRQEDVEDLENMQASPLPPSPNFVSHAPPSFLQGLLFHLIHLPKHFHHPNLEKPTNEMLVGYFLNGLRKELKNAIVGVDIAGGLQALVETAQRAEKRFGVSHGKASKRSSKDKRKSRWNPSCKSVLVFGKSMHFAKDYIYLEGGFCTSVSSGARSKGGLGNNLIQSIANDGEKGSSSDTSGGPSSTLLSSHFLACVESYSSSIRYENTDCRYFDGRRSGSKRQKLMLGSPTIDVKSPFKVSWKDLEESDSKANFFSTGSELKKSKSKGKKVTLFPSGIIGSAGKNDSDNSLAREGGNASHLIMGIFSMKEATNCLIDLSKFLHSQDEALKVLENAQQEHKCSDGKLQKICLQLIQEQSNREKLQLEVVKLQAEGKEMISEILSVAEDFQQWVDGLKTAVDEQFKDLDEKVAALTTENVMLINRLNPLAKMEKAVLQGRGMSRVLVANFDADVLKQEVLEYAQDMWNQATKLWREHMALLQEMRTNRKEIEDSLSKLRAEISSGPLESDQNLAVEARNWMRISKWIRIFKWKRLWNERLKEILESSLLDQGIVGPGQPVALATRLCQVLPLGLLDV